MLRDVGILPDTINHRHHHQMRSRRGSPHHMNRTNGTPDLSGNEYLQQRTNAADDLNSVRPPLRPHKKSLECKKKASGERRNTIHTKEIGALI